MISKLLELVMVVGGRTGTVLMGGLHQAIHHPFGLEIIRG